VNEPTPKQDSQSLTGFLKALVVGAAVVFGASAAQASLSSKPVTPKPDQDADEPLESRVDRVRKEMAQSDAKQQQPADLPNNSAPLDDAKTMWWRNWGNWHNGNWPNWRNGGWRNGNWGNGGGGWRNGGRWWANF